jgi:hypothetical protein
MPAPVHTRKPGEPLLDEDLGIEPLVITPLDELDFDLIDPIEPAPEQP